MSFSEQSRHISKELRNAMSLYEFQVDEDEIQRLTILSLENSWSKIPEYRSVFWFIKIMSCCLSRVCVSIYYMLFFSFQSLGHEIAANTSLLFDLFRICFVKEIDTLLVLICQSDFKNKQNRTLFFRQTSKLVRQLSND